MTEIALPPTDTPIDDDIDLDALTTLLAGHEPSAPLRFEAEDRRNGRLLVSALLGTERIAYDYLNPLSDGDRMRFSNAVSGFVRVDDHYSNVDVRRMVDAFCWGYVQGGTSITTLPIVSALDLRRTDRPLRTSLPLLGQLGYFIKGWSHLVAGYGKSGKTTLISASVPGWGDTRLLWVTEESRAVWEERLPTWDTLPPNLKLVFGLGASRGELLATAAQSDAEVVIYDTIRNLFQLEDENNNSEIVRVLTPFVAALSGRTQIYVHHTSKEGGEHGKAIVGGGAFLGAVDRAIEVKFVERQRFHRRIEVNSRIENAPDLLYEMVEGHLVARGLAEDVKIDRVEDRAAAVLKSDWQYTGQIMARIGDPKPSLPQLRNGLTALAKREIAQRSPALGEEAQGQRVAWRKKDAWETRDG